MSERLGDVTTRIAAVRQLSSVIGAMRGIAAARAREALGQLDGIRTYARTVADAIGHALAFVPEAAHAEPAGREGARGDAGGHAVIALCAEQGFAGVFSERVLDAAVGTGPGAALLLVGDRGLMVAGERGLEPAWSAPMIAHAGQAATTAGRIIEELYRRLDAEEVARVTIVHAAPGPSGTIQIARKALLPFDFGRFPPARGGGTPLITLPPRVLLARLAEEYVFAEICEALMLSFAAESEARMRAMIAARTHVDETLDGLVGRSRQLRQEEITNEILELAGGAQARGAV